MKGVPSWTKTALPIALQALSLYAIWRHTHKSPEPDVQQHNMLMMAGNGGYSPACGYVMQLYRDGKLSGENSVLRGQNLMGANWQNVVLPKADLEGINLQHANLQDAYFVESNLQRVDFDYANLERVNFHCADLSEAGFMSANLKNAELSATRAYQTSFYMAHMQRATIRHVDLSNCDFTDSDLHGVDLTRTVLRDSLFQSTNLAKANLERACLLNVGLMDANLTGANFNRTRFDEQTILPDAKFVEFVDGKPMFDKYWTPDTDMSKYTDPNHPDFWQPQWVSKYDWVKQNYKDDLKL